MYSNMTCQTTFVTKSFTASVAFANIIFKMQFKMYIIVRDTSDIQYWGFQEQEDYFTKTENQTQFKLFI